MATSITIRDISITALNDGTCMLPTIFYPGLDFIERGIVLDDDGTHHIPTGCFLLQGPDFTILVDAGIGPDNIPFPDEIAAAAGLSRLPEFVTDGGHLPDALTSIGVLPGHITLVFLTHLHEDHIGWVAPDRKLHFPNAGIVYGAADWDALIAPLPPDNPSRISIETARSAGVLRAINDATVEIAPGVTAHHAPGHTPGQYVLSVVSGGSEGYLLGDAVHHPLQLQRKDIHFLTDTDSEQAATTRKGLFQLLADRGAAIGMSHHPGLEFQRIGTLGGRHWSTA